jgi:hypothetical protein
MSSDNDAWDDGGEPVAATSTQGDGTSTFGDGEYGDGDGGFEEDGHEEADDEH